MCFFLFFLDDIHEQNSDKSISKSIVMIRFHILKNVAANNQNWDQFYIILKQRSGNYYSWISIKLFKDFSHHGYKLKVILFDFNRKLQIAHVKY